MPLRILVALVVCLCFVQTARAEVRIIETEYTYVLGESDTRAAARKACFVEAKRLALEQAGTFTHSETTVENMALTRDEIRTFATAFVEATLVEERFHTTGDTFAVTCKVRSEVDPKLVAERMEQFSKSEESRERLARLADRVRELEEKAGTLPGEKLNPVKPKPTPKKKETIREKKARLDRERQKMYASVREFVEPGMLRSDVLDLVGFPAMTKVNNKMTAKYQCENYGNIWVVYRDGIVACTRNRLKYEQRYRGDCHCYGSPTEVFSR